MTAQQHADRAGFYGSNIGANILAAAVAETIGTFILVYGGIAVAVAALLGNRSPDPATTLSPPPWRSAWPCSSWSPLSATFPVLT